MLGIGDEGKFITWWEARINESDTWVEQLSWLGERMTVEKTLEQFAEEYHEFGHMAIVKKGEEGPSYLVFGGKVVRY